MYPHSFRGDEHSLRLFPRRLHGQLNHAGHRKLTGCEAVHREEERGQGVCVPAAHRCEHVSLLAHVQRIDLAQERKSACRIHPEEHLQARACVPPCLFMAAQITAIHQ
jgi:hypothetical protein